MKNNAIWIGVAVGLIVVIVGGYLFAKKFLAPAPVSYQASTYYKKEDINKDGKVDQVDEAIIQKHFGCQLKQPCWTTVIGKTLSGDNPIYTSDLDMNGDNIIDLLDIQQLKTAE